MKVLVVGSGAREHAIVWKLATSPQVSNIYCAPGNGGTALIAQNVALAADTEAECDQLAGWAFSNGIDLVIVGPEVPLRHGIADSLMMLGVPVMGPSQLAARIEWSKVWARDFMARHNIPSPGFRVIEGLMNIIDFVQDPGTKYPLVLKADGLAAGKGAAVVGSATEAEEAIKQMHLMKALTANGSQASGEKMVVEEYLEGLEVSALAFTDGTRVAMMPPACDYKRLLDGDAGPMTGGVGAYSPVPAVTPELWKQVEEEVLLRAVRGMAEEGAPFRGVLYAGLMLGKDGPKVLEFNCRLGDPEAQVLLPRLQTPLEDIGMAIAKGDLSQAGAIAWDDQATVGVVVASGNYPQGKADGVPISGLSDVEEGTLVFHAGTEIRGLAPLDPGHVTWSRSVFRDLFSSSNKSAREPALDLELRANGGRILTVVGRGRSLQEARDAAYHNVARIRIEDSHYRRDIAARELDRG